MFCELKVGDEVPRQMGSDGPTMRMIVVAIDEEHIYCDAVTERPMEGLPLDEHWKFDRVTGIEEDEELGWGKKFGVTGTRLLAHNQGKSG